MATKMAATLVVPNNGFAIAGQKFTCSLTLTESGGTSTNLVSIQPYAYLAGGVPSAQSLAQGVRFGTVANAATIAQYTGAALTINASSSQTFNYDAVIDAPASSVGNSSQADAGYYVTAICQTSDGSVFQPPPIYVSLSQPSTGPSTSSPSPNETSGTSVILGSTTPQYSNTAAPGRARFDIGANSYLIPFLV